MPCKIFVSYSHLDKKEKDELVVHLKSLAHVDIQTWTDEFIGAGEKWYEKIIAAMEDASIAILLLTKNFLGSEFIRDKEIPELLKKMQEDRLVIIPVLAKECAWNSIPWLKSIEIRPKSVVPIWNKNVDETYTDKSLVSLVNEIKDLVDKISEEKENASIPTELFDRKKEIMGDDVDFVNRVKELDKIFERVEPYRTWVVDAPAGYGKTRLLQKIRQKYEEKRWITVDFSIDENDVPSIYGLGNGIVQKISHKHIAKGKPILMGNRIARFLLQCNYVDDGNLEVTSNRGIVILIDNVELLHTETINDLKDMLDGINDGLRGANFFHKNKHELRVILAGRYLRKCMSDITSRFAYTSLELTMYTFDAVRETVQNFANKIIGNLSDEKIITHVAAHLMYVTEGHPGCMAQILHEQALERFTEAKYILENEKEALRVSIVFPALENLLSKDDDAATLIPILEKLSVFRRYDTKLLKEFLKEKLIIWEGGDEYDLEVELLNFYLIQRRNGFLQDGITRRLLAMRLRYREPDDFEKLISDGVVLYEKALARERIRHPEVVAIEWFYLKIMKRYYIEGIRGQRLLAKAKLDIRYIINKLTTYWDIREILPDFIDVLAGDDELLFIINFFVSESEYLNEPFEELIRFVKSF